MADTVESLDAELQRQKRSTAKLLDLLRRIEGALPDPDGRVAPLIIEVERTKHVLDNCERMLEEKRRTKP